MTVVLDTNVLLSAALRDRLPERVVLHIASHEGFRWLVTPEILSEYVGVLRRPKFGLSATVLEQWTQLLDLRTVNVGSPSASVDFPRDPKDAPFMAAALMTAADWLITGDQDLLQARPIPPTRIATIAQFAIELGITYVV